MSRAGRYYYSKQPGGESSRFTIDYNIKTVRRENIDDGGVISFISDSGVFSKNRVDFGTDLLIRSIPPLSGRALDLGCGYGAAGISLALLNPAVEFWFSDVNERAIELCRINYTQLVAKNKPYGHNINILCSDGFDMLGDIKFDTIVTNPPIRTGKENIYRLYGEAFSHLNAGGMFFLVIQKKQGMESTYQKLTGLFGNCGDIARKAGYHVLASVKRQ